MRTKRTPDLEARTRAFNKLRRMGRMTRADAAKVTGLTANSIRIYSAPSSPYAAATWATIELLRQEAIRSAKKEVDIAEDALFRREIHLQNLERMQFPPAADQS